jgi:hypothetical protein
MHPSGIGLDDINCGYPIEAFGYDRVDQVFRDIQLVMGVQSFAKSEVIF